MSYSVVRAVISIMGHCSAVGVLWCRIHGQSMINMSSGHTCGLLLGQIEVFKILNGYAMVMNIWIVIFCEN